MASLAVVSMLVTTAVIPDPNVTVSYPSCLDSVSYFNVTAAIVPNSNITFLFISLGKLNSDRSMVQYVRCSSGGTGFTHTYEGSTMFAFIQTKCDPNIGPDFNQPFYLTFTLRALDPMQAKNAFNTNLIVKFGYVKPNDKVVFVIDSRGPSIQRIMAQCPVEASEQTIIGSSVGSGLATASMSSNIQAVDASDQANIGSAGKSLIGSSVGSGLATASMSTNIQVTEGSDADLDQAKNAASRAASLRRAILATALGACAWVWRCSGNEGGYSWSHLV